VRRNLFKKIAAEQKVVRHNDKKLYIEKEKMKMKKTIKLLILIAIIIITLTGCVSIDYEVEINKDGTGKISYVYAYDKEYLKSMEYSGEEMSKDLKENAEEDGYKVEAYSDNEKEGIKISKDVEDVTNGISFEELFEGYVKDSEENNIKKEDRKFSQNAVIDLTRYEWNGYLCFYNIYC